MPNEDNKILKYNHGKKPLKVSFIIYADLESLLKKHILVKIILKNFTQREKLSIYLQVTHGVQFAHLMHQKNERSHYREQDCMKTLCEDFRDQAMKIINYD